MEFTSKNLEKVIQSEKTVMVEFWGSWCPPCQQMKNVLDNLEKTYDDRVKIGKINIDRNPEVSKKYNVIGVPAYVIFQNGEIVLRDVGAKTENQLKEMIEKVI